VLGDRVDQFGFVHDIPFLDYRFWEANPRAEGRYSNRDFSVSSAQCNRIDGIAAAQQLSSVTSVGAAFAYCGDARTTGRNTRRRLQLRRASELETDQCLISVG
jgi:hypothetical protein